MWNRAMDTRIARLRIAKGEEKPCKYPRENICHGCNALKTLDKLWGFKPTGHYLRIPWKLRISSWFKRRRFKSELG
jgi:hypothetical protein